MDHLTRAGTPGPRSLLTGADPAGSTNRQLGPTLRARRTLGLGPTLRARRTLGLGPTLRARRTLGLGPARAEPAVGSRASRHGDGADDAARRALQDAPWEGVAIDEGARLRVVEVRAGRAGRQELNGFGCVAARRIVQGVFPRWVGVEPRREDPEDTERIQLFHVRHGPRIPPGAGGCHRVQGSTATGCNALPPDAMRCRPAREGGTGREELSPAPRLARKEAATERRRPRHSSRMSDGTSVKRGCPTPPSFRHSRRTSTVQCDARVPDAALRCGPGSTLGSGVTPTGETPILPPPRKAMFTGIVERTARVAALEDRPGRRVITLELKEDRRFGPWDPAAAGESIAVDGVCLTVVAKRGPAEKAVSFDAVPETLRLTTWDASASATV